MDDVRGWLTKELKALRPSFISKDPHFNFISVHYFWIMGLALLGSVIIFGAGSGDVAYIDALFFATGANTQAGLNTIDVSVLNTFQQAMLYVMAMLSNPITINSFVVLLRLYWFEKRFQHVVREARMRRGTISKSNTTGRTDSTDAAERGVAGRNITVMRDGQRSRITNDGIVLDEGGEGGEGRTTEGFFVSGAKDIQSDSEDNKNVRSSSSAEHGDARPTEIRFADQVRQEGASPADGVGLPQPRSDQEHIAILERQRKGDDEVLRIPGPRDAERGMRPKRVEEGDEEEPERNALSRKSSNATGERSSKTPTQPNQGQGRPQTIVIEEPDRREREDPAAGEWVHEARAVANTFSFLRFRKPRFFNKKDKQLHRDEDNVHVHVQPFRYSRRPTFDTFRTAFSRDKDMGTPYLSWEPTIGRNSAFPDLSQEQREELGGIEYRSLKTLALILTVYFWGFSIFAVACMLPWILNSTTYGPIVDNVAQSRTWWGFFTANSAFTDLGFTLTPDSMNSFNTAVFPLLIMSFLIVVGNTGFPVMLRFMIWMTSVFVPRDTGLYEELRFLLDHPRRCFTLLFPSGATWWLFWLLVILNGTDLILFIILDLGSGPINALPGGIKVLDGLFQAASTRTAGFSCVNLANLHPGVQVSYMIMMYISVFPIAISVRRTNVYEEKSLGVYSSHNESEAAATSDLSYVGAHLRRQLSFDLWYIFVGFFILSISEGSRLMSNDISMFAVLFEVVSAYGTVGMSLGYSTVNASLSSQFSVVGKLVIIAMMIRGRHRGLPYGLDRAILLPSDALNAKDAEDAENQQHARLLLTRRNSQLSVATNGAGAGAGRGRAASRGPRGRSMERANTNILTSLLHPGPALPPKMPPNPTGGGLLRRSTDPVGTGSGSSEDVSPYATRRLSRRAETALPETGTDSRPQ